MTDQPIYLTEEGAEALRNELERLTSVERPAIAVRLRDAIQMGDLRENADYHEAKRQQGFIEGRILELEATLRKAVIIQEESATDMVRVGHRVTIREEGTDDDEAYQLVGPTEANPRDGRISNESPIGRALMGRRVGDVVDVQTPGGVIAFEIVRIDQV